MVRMTITALAAVALAACQKAPPRDTPLERPVPQVAVQAAAPPASPPARKPAPAPATLDEYKVLVAERIVAANPALAFTGRLPPMMRSIVVLDISIDRDGGLKRVRVHRSRNNQAAQLAVGAVKRAEKALPKPGKLLERQHKTLDFTETFLFNDEFKFQLRSLSGPQVVEAASAE